VTGEEGEGEGRGGGEKGEVVEGREMKGVWGKEGSVGAEVGVMGGSWRGGAGADRGAC
jgi:hypothetical protein